MSSSRFNIEVHGLVTGDLVFYNADETTGIDTENILSSGDPDSFSAETLTDLSGETLTLDLLLLAVHHIQSLKQPRDRSNKKLY